MSGVWLCFNLGSQKEGAAGKKDDAADGTADGSAGNAVGTPLAAESKGGTGAPDGQALDGGFGEHAHSDSGAGLASEVSGRAACSLYLGTAHQEPTGTRGSSVSCGGGSRYVYCSGG